MNKIISALSVACILLSCGEQRKKQHPIEATEGVDVVSVKEYPTALNNVFNAHGGMTQWNAMNALSFRMNNNGSIEVHTTDLKNRNEKIDHKDWSIGSNDKELWVLEHTPESYSGNALFYKNLMFYFYAMPFVVGDNGVFYTPLPPTTLDGIAYNAIKMSFDKGVGYSPTDEYIIYSDPESNKMIWLGYTVTGNSGKKSDRWSFIKYVDWQEVNGLLLPKTLRWYEVENQKPTILKGERTFDEAAITATVLDAAFFSTPKKATVLED